MGTLARGGTSSQQAFIKSGLSKKEYKRKKRSEYLQKTGKVTSESVSVSLPEGNWKAETKKGKTRYYDQDTGRYTAWRTFEQWKKASAQEIKEQALTKKLVAEGDYVKTRIGKSGIEKLKRRRDKEQAKKVSLYKGDLIQAGFRKKTGRKAVQHWWAEGFEPVDRTFTPPKGVKIDVSGLQREKPIKGSQQEIGYLPAYKYADILPTSVTGLSLEEASALSKSSEITGMILPYQESELIKGFEPTRSTQFAEASLFKQMSFGYERGLKKGLAITPTFAFLDKETAIAEEKFLQEKLVEPIVSFMPEERMVLSQEVEIGATLTKPELITAKAYREAEFTRRETPRLLAGFEEIQTKVCLLYTSPSPRDATLSRMPSSA